MMKNLSDLNLRQEGIMDFFTRSPIGIYIVQNRRFTCFNNKFREITGYRERELRGRDPMNLVLPEDQKTVRRNAVEMLKGQRTEPYRYRIRDKTGDIRWIIETLASVDYEGGRAALGNFMDITETEELRAALLRSPIGIYMIQDQRFIFSNAQFQEITGYTQAELSKMAPHHLIFPEDRSQVRENAVKMLKGKQTEAYQFRIVNKAGDLCWIIETGASVRHQERRAVLGNFMDVTQSRRLEKILKDSEKKYRSLFQMAREGIVLVHYKDGSILEANPEFLRQVNYDAVSIRGMKFWDMQPPEFRNEARETFMRFRETSGGIISWRLFHRKDGKIMPVEIMAQHMVLEGMDVIFCLIRDISEREAMMRALTEASEEWRKSFDAIDDVMLVIDHEFYIRRANLAAARMVKMDVRDVIGKPCFELFHGTEAPPPYCPHQKARVRGIYCEAEEKEPHLDRLLHFSAAPMKDDKGEIQSVVEIISDVTARRRQEQESALLSVSLAKSFQGITESMSELAESRDPYTAGHSRHVADLTILVGREMGYDEEKLQGLRTCAILHDIGKSIIPAAILNKPGKLSDHEWGLIRAHPATAYESLRHIPFPWPVADVVYQHHERLDGSGYPLGLKGNQIHPWARILAVADVVDAVTSHRPYRPGKPRQNAIDALLKGRENLYDPKAVDTLIRVLSLGDRRVLVVDEDARSLQALIEELKAEGLEAEGFSDPNQALEAFAEKPFPLVMTELNMLNMDGAELTAEIKRKNPSSEVIVVTRYGSKEDMLRIFRAGASDFLEKPIDLDLLIKSVNRAFQRFMGKMTL
jgi:PAS domain S-box-containing protein/putative nucleotidyltransferase with HDIG domain